MTTAEIQSEMSEALEKSSELTAKIGDLRAELRSDQLESDRLQSRTLELEALNLRLTDKVKAARIEAEEARRETDRASLERDVQAARVAAIQASSDAHHAEADKLRDVAAAVTETVAENEAATEDTKTRLEDLRIKSRREDIDRLER